MEEYTVEEFRRRLRNDVEVAISNWLWERGSEREEVSSGDMEAEVQEIFLALKSRYGEEYIQSNASTLEEYIRGKVATAVKSSDESTSPTGSQKKARKKERERREKLQLASEQKKVLANVMDMIERNVEKAKVVAIGNGLLVLGENQLPREEFVQYLMDSITIKYPELTRDEIKSVRDFAWMTLAAKIKRRKALVDIGSKTMEQKSATRVNERTSLERVQLYYAAGLLITGMTATATGFQLLTQAEGWEIQANNAPQQSDGSLDPAYAAGQWQDRMGTGNYQLGYTSIVAGLSSIAGGIGMVRSYMGWCTRCIDTIHRQDIDRENAQDSAAPYVKELEKIAEDKKDTDKEFARIQGETEKLKTDMFLASEYSGEDSSKGKERLGKLIQLRLDLAKLEAAVVILEKIQTEAEGYCARYYDAYRAKHPKE